MIIALIGSTTDPKARKSSTNIVTARNSPTQGSRSPRPSSRSTCAAEAPPTRTSAPAGVGTARTSSTRVSEARVLRLAGVGDDHVRRAAVAPDHAGRRDPGDCCQRGDVRRRQRQGPGRGGRRRPSGSTPRCPGKSCSHRLGGDPALGAGRKDAGVDATEGDPEERCAQDEQDRDHGDRTGMGRRMTPGRAVPTRRSQGRWGERDDDDSTAAALRRASTFGPSTPSNAGSTVSAATIATSTAEMPPAPMDRRKFWGKSSSEDSATATVSPENATVRPAVATVRATASSTEEPRAQLLPEAGHHEQRVVDGQAQAEHRHDVDGEDRDVAEQRQRPQRGECAEDRRPGPPRRAVRPPQGIRTPG